MTFKRNTRKPDTFGMLRRCARKHEAVAAGRAAVSAGRHAGGPCPAVALATLTGWTYKQAHEWLVRHGDFKGAGLTMPKIVPAYEAALQQDADHTVAPRCTVRQAVARFFAGGKSGAVANRRHIMPVIEGRLLNAFGNHADRQCTDVVIFHDYEA